MFDYRGGTITFGHTNNLLFNRNPGSVDTPCRSSNGITNIEQCCYLKTPDRTFYNEFPRLCPVHGCLSRPRISEEESCLETCLKHCKPALPGFSNILENGIPRPLDSVGDYLKYVRRNGFAFPLPSRGNPGSAMDPYEKRIKALEFDAMISRPKSPVVVDTYTFRARRPDEYLAMKPTLPDPVLTHVYRYCRDLGLVDEVVSLFLADLRHEYPDGYVRRPAWKHVTVLFRPDRFQTLTFRVFPGEKYFVCGIRHNAFTNNADLHFGDQVIEIMPACIQNQISDTPRKSHVDNANCYRFHIIPSPFLKKIQLRVHDCQIIDESKVKKKTMENMRSQRDLGIIILQGKVVHVDKFSPAKMCGIQPDYRIIEVAGESVLEYSDSHIIRLIRNGINSTSAKSVELTVIPTRIYDVIVDPRKGQLFTIVKDAEFDVNAWTDNKVFGAR